MDTSYSLSRVIRFLILLLFFLLQFSCSSSCIDSNTPPGYQSMVDKFNTSKPKTNQISPTQSFKGIVTYFDVSGSMVTFARDMEYTTLLSKYLFTINSLFIDKNRPLIAFGDKLQTLTNNEVLNYLNNTTNYKGNTDIAAVIHGFRSDTLLQDHIQVIITDGIPMLDLKPDMHKMIEEISHWIDEGKDFTLIGVQTKKKNNFYFLVFGNRIHLQSYTEKLKRDLLSIEGVRFETILVPGSRYTESLVTTVTIHPKSRGLLVPIEDFPKSDQNYRGFRFSSRDKALLHINSRAAFYGGFNKLYYVLKDPGSVLLNSEYYSVIDNKDGLVRESGESVKLERCSIDSSLDSVHVESDILILPPNGSELSIYRVCIYAKPEFILPDWLNEWSSDGPQQIKGKTPYLKDFVERLIDLSREKNKPCISEVYIALSN